MNCPNCGKEMETGVIYSSCCPEWTTGGLRLRPAGNPFLSLQSFVSGYEYPGSALCRACGIALFPFEPKE